MDKYKHYIVGTWIATLWLSFFNKAIWFDFLGQFNVFVGFALFLIGIIGFEFYQKWFKKGTKDWGDVIAGGLGGLVILIVILATR